MKREQIIEILSNELQDGNIEMHHINIEQLAEKLDLPLEVLSDEEIELKYPYPSEYYKLNPIESEEETILNKMKKIQEISDKHKVAKWMRDEIIKLNTKP